MKEVIIKSIKPAFEDERGKISDILDDENILHVGIITSKKGTIRGNHYHNKAKQFNYILKGKMELTIKKVDGDDPERKYILQKGDFVGIPVRVIHSLRALEDSEFIDLNTESRSGEGYEDDVVRI